MFVWVDLPHACFGLDVVDGKVTVAPPIAKYTVGWTVKRALTYFNGRGRAILVMPG